MTKLFEEIAVERVSDKISEQIIKLIADGTLKPGDRLPGERQLIELLGVGRSSLREALNRLETLGYIEVRKRKGNFVRSVDTSFQRNPLKTLIQGDLSKIIQLYEIRRDLEQASAYNAALNRTDEDLELIAEALHQFRKSDGAASFSWESDRQFHLAIAQASHNFLRVHVLTNIFSFAEEFLQPALVETTDHAENCAAIADQHEAIFRAIEKQEADTARCRMDEHLRWTNEQIVQVLNRPQSTK